MTRIGESTPPQEIYIELGSKAKGLWPGYYIYQEKYSLIQSP